MKTPIFAMICLVLALAGTNAAAAGAAYSVWTASSLEKVLKRTPIKPWAAAKVSAARGEHEAFQIVLRAGRAAIEKVSVSAGPLRCDKQEIPAASMQVYLPAYIYLPALSEYYPDPLPPYQKPFDLAAGQTQPVWVDVSVPRNAKPGTYSGTVTISAGNAGSTSVPVSLRVYDFELPAGPKMATAFGLWSNKYIELGHGLKPDAPEAAALHKKYYDFLLDHGVSTFADVPGEMDSDEWAKYVTDPRVTSFRIAFTKDEKEMRKRLDRVRSLGVWDKGYLYFVDEPKDEKQYKELQDGCSYLRKLDPKVNIVSPYYCNPAFVKDKTVYDLLKGYINVWCFVTNFYNEKSIDERRAAGDKIWDYVCCGPGKPYANFFVDFAPLEHRMLFWQNYLYQVSGLLYWDTIYWDAGGTTDPWTDIATVKWIRSNIYGDGSLLYPGKKVGIDGPVSSIRLECIRDGIEDYSYLWLLEQKLGREAVLPYVKKLATNWTEFTRDPSLFSSVRQSIAEQIENAGKRKDSANRPAN